MQRLLLVALLAALFTPGFTPAALADHHKEGEKPAEAPAKEAPAKEAPAEDKPAPDKPKTAADIDTVTKRVSYFLGWRMASQTLAGSGIEPDDLDMAMITRGMMDALKQVDPQVTQDDVQAAFEAFQKKMQERQAAKQQAVATKNKEEGEKFLAANKDKEGVKTTESGLQYKVLKAGEGDSPDANDTVTVHYKGTLIDGTEFDSSYKRGEPTSFPVNGVIKGWTEALQLMKPGAKYELYIPSDLAYGVNGPRPGSPIGPNATLIFEVELIKVEKNE